MEGTLFPNRPAFPAQPTNPATHHRLKFNTSSLPLPPLLPQQQQQSSSTSSHSFHLNSLLHVSHPVKSSLASPRVVSSRNQDPLSAQFGKDDGGSSIATPMGGEGSVNDGRSFDFLLLNCKLILNSIPGVPIPELRSFLDSVKSQLLH